MKFLFVICSLCVMMVLIEGGAVDSAESTEGSGSSAEDNRSCPNSPRKGRDYALNCLMEHDNALRLRHLTTIEEFRQFFSNYCQELPTVQKCFSTVLTEFRRCFHQADQHSYQIYIGTLNITMNLACADNGEPLATMFNAFKGPNKHEDVYQLCWNTVFTNKNITELDQPGRILFLYNNVNVLKECLMEGIEDDENLRNTLGAVFDGLRNEMHCIHPELKSVVLCSTIETVSN